MANMDERLKTAIDLARTYPYMEPEDLMQNLDLRKEPCPENRCGHPVNVHIRVNKKLVCTAEGCTCSINETTAMGIIIAEYKEAIQSGARQPLAQGMPAPPPEPVVIPDDLFSPIVGFDDIKHILRRSLLSPRPVHQLLHGPPASAKTLFALEMERVGAARYALGSSSSKAGLRQMLMEDQPRILIIDELDKGNRRDHSVLLSVMESGILVESLYGRHDGVRLETRVFATANDKTVLPTELLSRFGGGLRIREYTPEEFLEVASRVLVIREGAPEDIAKVIATSTLEQLRSRDVRDCVRIYRIAQDIDEVPRIVDILRTRR